MCCCGQPNVNGQPGYRWHPDNAPSVRPVDPPVLVFGEELIFDEPGRCGGVDAHSHHFRVVTRNGSHWLYVRHGVGDEAIRLVNGRAVERALLALDSHARYWLLHAVYSAAADARLGAAERTTRTWRKAAAEGRIKVRKLRGRDARVVTLLPESR